MLWVVLVPFGSVSVASEVYEAIIVVESWIFGIFTARQVKLSKYPVKTHWLSVPMMMGLGRKQSTRLGLLMNI